MRGIYLIKNTKNNKVYVGESLNIIKRWEEHITDLNECKHCNFKLQEDWDKYGEENFEFNIVAVLDDSISTMIDKIICIIYENKIINEFNSIDNGYNLENTYEKVIKGEKVLTTTVSNIYLIKEYENRINKGIIVNKGGIIFKNEVPLDKNKKSKNRYDVKHKKVICIETGKIYKNAKEATIECGVSGTGSVTTRCRKGGGRVKLKNGKYLNFKYYDESNDK